MYFRFDEFNLIRQAILLTIDTFGFSHIFPIFGLPFLVACCCPPRQTKRLFSMRLCQVNFLLENFIYNFNGFWAVITDTVMFQVYLMYGLITAVSVTFTILCVTIQRRHLMVYTRICWDLHAFEILNESVDTNISNSLAGMGIICSKICFWCSRTCSYWYHDLFIVAVLHGVSTYGESRIFVCPMIFNHTSSLNRFFAWHFIFRFLKKDIELRND